MSKAASRVRVDKGALQRRETFFVKCHGCARSGMNAEKVRHYLIKNGLAMVDAAEKADHIFVLTCGLFTPTPYELHEIQEFDKLKGELVVCGCLPAMEPERLAEVFNGRTVITKELERIDELFPDFRYKFKDMDDVNRLFKNGEGLGDYYLDKKTIELTRGRKNLFKRALDHEISVPLLNRTNLPRLIEVDPHHHLVRVSRGCIGNCSYCAIKFAIGRLESKDPDEIIKEVQGAVSKGRYDLEIISDDTGAYGLDIGTNMISLLERILDVDEKIRIVYLQDVHPHYLCKFGDELIGLIKTGRIKSLQSAVQSGSERVLRLMNRPLDVERYKTMINKMKKAYPKIKIRTQIIVGFPSETEDDFNDSVRLLRECHFDQVDVYQYREYGSCASAKITPKVSKEIMEKRQNTLMQMERPRLIIFSRVTIFRMIEQLRFIISKPKLRR
ncbi:MAG: radical SAM protein [Thermoplasmatota archaeon]